MSVYPCNALPGFVELVLVVTSLSARGWDRPRRKFYAIALRHQRVPSGTSVVNYSGEVREVGCMSKAKRGRQKTNVRVRASHLMQHSTTRRTSVLLQRKGKKLSAKIMLARARSRSGRRVRQQRPAAASPVGTADYLNSENSTQAS
jgi:hypothetical protein